MDLTFIKGTEPIVVRVKGRELYFAKVQGGRTMFAPIEGLRLNPAGIVKEFPDLEGKPIIEIKKAAIKRFKEHIKSLNSLNDIRNYLQKDLVKHGYKLIMVQRNGFRPERVK